MKYRTPVVAEDFDISSKAIPEYKARHSKTYDVKVITPIYGGGVIAGEPDKTMPIRASAIRGQLRYWWRFLAMNCKESPLSGEALFEAERNIWGGIGDKKGEDYSSTVMLKTSEIKCPTSLFKPCGHYNKNRKERGGKVRYTYPFIFDHNIPDYSLFCAQGKPPKDGDDTPEEKPQEIILPELTFRIELSAHFEEQGNWDAVKEAFRWWVCFGGIGARTRRGLGSVEIPDKRFKPLTKDEVKDYRCELRYFAANNANDAWNKVIKKLQIFRQGVGVGRNQKKDSNGNLVTYGRNKTPAQGGSRWPEPDSIREITKDSSLKHNPTHPARLAFPRAAFGLPIIFKFNNNDEKAGDPKQSELRPTDSERMSSPLILKAMATKNGYKAIALKLPTNQSRLTLELKELPSKPNNLAAGKEHEWKDKGWERWPEIWWDDSKASDVKPIKDNNGTDALTAFMEYFTKGEDSDA